MYDLQHDWGADLVIGSTGDLALAKASDVTTQRVFRRLLTNPGDYIWHLEYGGGLARYVGAPADISQIEAVILDQLEQEAAIATSPPPLVSAKVTDAANGYLAVDISYSDAGSASTAQLQIPIGP